MKNTVKSQSGRSMVEMLGTLAIIGVLSIGGIMGYSYAVDRYHANQIMNDVNLRAIDLIAQVNRGGALSLSEWPDKTAGGCDIGLEIDTATNTTEGGIFVHTVSKDICETIAENLLPENIKLVIDGIDYTEGNCGETNDMVFYYDAISGDTSGGDTGNGEGNTSSGGDTGNGEGNTPSGDDTENGEENTPPEEVGCNGVMIDDICMPCPSNTTLSSNKEECICSDGGPFNFETNDCLTSCEKAFNNVFQVGDMRGDLVTASGSTVTLDMPADGTETTFTMISDGNASHCKLNIVSGQNIVLDTNGHSLMTKGLAVSGVLTMTDSSAERNARILTNNLDILGVMTMNGGTIDTNKISISEGGMNMSGGYIQGNTTISGSAFFNMTGGTVEGNIMASDESTFNMSGGTIEGNMTLSSPNVSITGGMVGSDTFLVSGGVTIGISGGEFDIGTLTCSDTSGIEVYFPSEYFNVVNMQCDNVSNYWDI